MQSQPSSSEPTNPGDLRPFKDPNRGLDEVLKQLESEEWYGRFSFRAQLRFSLLHEVLLTKKQK